MIKVYIAGPMRGFKNFNFDNFDLASKYLKSQGFHTISPADLDRVYDNWNPYPPENLEITIDTKRNCIRRDIEVILSMDPSNGDFIYMLKGWENSLGAKTERALGMFMGLQIIEQGDQTKC